MSKKNLDKNVAGVSKRKQAKTFARNARELRQAAGLTAQKASECLACSQGYLYQLEAKEHTPGTDILLAMAKLYSCSMEEILSEKKPLDRLRQLRADTLRRQARELEAKADQVEAGKAVGL